MVKWFAKRYATSLLNDALKEAEKKADIQAYVKRIQRIVSFLTTVLQTLEDNELSQAEIDKVIGEAKELFA